ncbi:MAG: glycosyltransferase family 1 protein [Betaproteobacteria bacterium]
MRIAFDHQIFGWQRFGGISRYFFELANHLAKAEAPSPECRIICPLFVNNYLVEAGAALQVTGVHVPAIRRTGRFYRMINSAFAPFLLESWRPDILHETYYSNKTVAPEGCRIVLTVFDMIHELYPEHFAAWDTTRKEKEVAVSRADHIICISENTRRDLIRLMKVPEEKTSVVHLGFSLTHQALSNLPPPRRPFLLFVGSRGGYKNFERLLQAYASRPELRNWYDLVAFGGGYLSGRECALIQKLNLDKEQVRQVDGDDGVLGALYQQAALFVYPSLYEGFGIPPLEAMSFDCPVACSNTSSMPEVVADAAIMFDPSDTESIASALERLCTDQALRVVLQQRGRDRLQTFSWRQCAVETMNIYRKVLQ